MELLVGLAVLIGAIVVACGLCALDNHRFNKQWAAEMRQDHINRYGCPPEDWDKNFPRVEVILQGDDIEQQKKKFKDAWEKAQAEGQKGKLVFLKKEITYDRTMGDLMSHGLNAKQLIQAIKERKNKENANDNQTK